VGFSVSRFIFLGAYLREVPPGMPRKNHAPVLAKHSEVLLPQQAKTPDTTRSFQAALGPARGAGGTNCGRESAGATAAVPSDGPPPEALPRPPPATSRRSHSAARSLNLPCWPPALGERC
ncbi:unnamed protein product, partial [Scytosiphon promiscuus]